jgi:phosphoribosylformimino-5-aminoimidazole carboxamide ribotide isomerase
MLVIPAIDLLGDEAVRLEQGDVDRVVLRERDPLALAARLAAAGAPLLHVVDLDGARAGSVRPNLVARIVAAAGPAAVQASGGIRSLADAEALLEAGVSRVVVGTAAFGSRAVLAELVEALGARLVVAVDVRDGRVAVAGWTESTGLPAGEAAAMLAAEGVERLLCTATARDGTLAGPDLDLVGEVLARSGLPVLAAGGVGSEADLDALAALGVEGAVVGRALLSGAVPLSVLGYSRSPTTTSDRRA